MFHAYRKIWRILNTTYQVLNEVLIFIIFFTFSARSRQDLSFSGLPCCSLFYYQWKGSWLDGILALAVAKLVVMLVMLSMTKDFLKMYVFLFAFIYFILFNFLIGIFFIFWIFSCMIFSDIFGYSDFRVFPMAASHARICCLWQQSCQPCSAGPSRRVGKALAWVALVMLFSNSMTS